MICVIYTKTAALHSIDQRTQATLISMGNRYMQSTYGKRV